MLVCVVLTCHSRPGTIAVAGRRGQLHPQVHRVEPCRREGRDRLPRLQEMPEERGLQETCSDRK